MSEVTEAEVVEPSLEIEHVEQDARMALFGTSEAVGVLERATAVADALAPVIANKHLFSQIQNRKHVRVEGWQTLGAMLGVFGVVTETKAITDDKGKTGWQARCEARTMSGAVIGGADAQCTRSEKNWANRDDFALRSMSQTRAISKALKGPLGFIIELAGYSATPAEEMDSREPEAQRGSESSGSQKTGSSSPSQETLEPQAEERSRPASAPPSLEEAKAQHGTGKLLIAARKVARANKLDQPLSVDKISDELLTLTLPQMETK